MTLAIIDLEEAFDHQECCGINTHADALWEDAQKEKEEGVRGPATEELQLGWDDWLASLNPDA